MFKITLSFKEEEGTGDKEKGHSYTTQRSDEYEIKGRANITEWEGVNCDYQKGKGIF